MFFLVKNKSDISMEFVAKIVNDKDFWVLSLNRLLLD